MKNAFSAALLITLMGCGAVPLKDAENALTATAKIYDLNCNGTEAYSDRCGVFRRAFNGVSTTYNLAVIAYAAHAGDYDSLVAQFKMKVKDLIEEFTK